MINAKYVEMFRDPEQVRAFTRRVLDEGCVQLADFFDQPTFDALLAYGSLGHDPGTIKWQDGTPAMNVARSPEVMGILDSIHRARCEIERTAYVPLDPKQTAVGLPRKVADDRSAAESKFHFDDSFINSVFALKLPTDSREGNLLIYPNLRRRARPRGAATLIARVLRHSPLLRKIFRPKEINYRAGALHVFFGDLTLHGVPPTTRGERLVLAINATRNLNRQA